MEQKLQLHDIKPLLEVQEYSLYYLILFVVFSAILIFGALYLGIKYFKNRNKYDVRVEHFKLLNQLNLSDTKKSAYGITKYGATYKDDSKRHSEMYKNLVDRLEQYKYKKDVEKFDNEVLGYIELYKGMIDV